MHFFRYSRNSFCCVHFSVHFIFSISLISLFIFGQRKRCSNGSDMWSAVNSAVRSSFFVIDMSDIQPSRLVLALTPCSVLFVYLPDV